MIGTQQRGSESTDDRVRQAEAFQKFRFRPLVPKYQRGLDGKGEVVRKEQIGGN